MPKYKSTPAMPSNIGQKSREGSSYAGCWTSREAKRARRLYIVRLYRHYADWRLPHHSGHSHSPIPILDRLSSPDSVSKPSKALLRATIDSFYHFSFSVPSKSSLHPQLLQIIIPTKWRPTLASPTSNRIKNYHHYLIISVHGFLSSRRSPKPENAG
jgi:hypothetical protein